MNFTDDVYLSSKVASLRWKAPHNFQELIRKYQGDVLWSRDGVLEDLFFVGVTLRC